MIKLFVNCLDYFVYASWDLKKRKKRESKRVFSSFFKNPRLHTNNQDERPL